MSSEYLNPGDLNPGDLNIINAWICQVGDRAIQPVFGNLEIKDGKISGIHPTSFQEFLNHPTSSEPPEGSLDAAGRVITLPLVNFHDHLYSRLAKGLNIQGSMENFHQILKNLWWKLDRALDLDMIKACAHMGALESIRQGVTYIFDHHASPVHTKESLATLAGVFQQYGLRGVFCFETSDRNGPSLARQGLEENQHFLKNHCTDDIKAMIGLHASFSLSDESLETAAQMIRELDTGIHIHLCEDKVDIERSQEFHGRLPLERLTRYDLLNDKSILSHGIHLTEADFSPIARAGSAIAYNPDSNMNNHVGLPVFNQAPGSIPILTGTDGMHANVARSLKQLFLLHRHQGNDFNATFQWLQKIYFDQLDFVHRYFPDFTDLQPGSRADLVVWDYVPPTPFSLVNFWGHYLYGILERPIHSVVQAGAVLMRNHQLLISNEHDVLSEIHKQGNRLFDAF